MNPNSSWRQDYQAALLETNPDRLHARIVLAEQSILRRISEIVARDPNFREEHVALQDALRGLRVLAATECDPARSSLAGPSASEATS